MALVTDPNSEPASPRNSPQREASNPHRPERREESISGEASVPTDRAQPSAPQAEADLPSTCLMVGPPGAGKTAFLRAMWPASAEDHSDYRMDFTFGPEVATLLKSKVEGTVEDAKYDFHVDLSQHSSNGKNQSNRVGVCSFSCVDGPGGALFPGNAPSVNPNADRVRENLVRFGRSAGSLIFILNASTEGKTRSNILRNLATLLSDLAVPTDVPITDTTSSERFNGGRGLFGRRREPAVTPSMPQTKRLPKLHAHRILFVFNFVDQLCVNWLRDWASQGDSRRNLSVFEIAAQYAQPEYVATEIFGKILFRQIWGFKRREAELAVSVCSASGFYRSSGDPFQDETGRANVFSENRGEELVEEIKYFGVREALLYAGFGIETPGIVKRLSEADLI